MKTIFKFQINYFLITLLLLTIEFFIAIFIHDDIIRPYIGDVLVVIFLYCFLKTFIKLDVNKTSLAILLFSFLVETLQYYKFIEIVGLQNSKIATIVIGTSFSFFDLIAYTVGAMIIILAENKLKHKKNKLYL